LRKLLAPSAEVSLEPGSVPTFSVVVPTYQAAAFVGEAIESALLQTLQPREVIVCDDGSTDDLEGALAPFRDRITLLRRPHSGAGAARNEAIRASSGDFVVMLDADDRYEPDRLRALGELARARPDLDILSTDAYLEFDGTLQGRFYEFADFPTQQQRLAILERCIVAWPALRRSRVLEVGGFDESPAIVPAEDWDLFLRLILSGSKAGIVTEPLMRYRRRPGSVTGNRSRTLQSRVVILEKARHDPHLKAEERPHLEACIARAAERALLFDAQAAVDQRPRRARRARLRELSHRAPTSTRLAMVVAMLVPGVGKPLLAWKERRAAGARITPKPPR
jgi:GT2 family glycosyltransferase